MTATLHAFAALKPAPAETREQRSPLALAAVLAPRAARFGGGSPNAVAAALVSGFRAKDPATGRHCEAVSTLAALVACELGLGPARVAELRRAGLVHDIGKIAVPTPLLRKQGPLEPAELAELRDHAPLGEAILRLAGLDREARWVRHHHERVDGRGYPDRLRGAEIPLESRIVLAADAFEAITADRPYRTGRPAAAALAELDRHAGEQLDRDCVAALTAVVERTAGSRAPGRLALLAD